MSPEIARILEELRALAERRGWARVVEFAGELIRGGPAPYLLITAADGADIEPIRRWIGREAPGLDIVTRPLRSLAEDPLPAVRADRVLVVVECGGVPGSEAVNALVGVLFRCPAESYAIVLTRADRITDENDLEMVQRMGWTLLVPGPKPDWKGQNLADHGVYLWSEEPARDVLASREATDAKALGRWLARPTDGDGTVRGWLDEHRAFHALGLADAELRRAETEAPASRVASARQVIDTRESLADVRSRLLSRIATATGALERSLTVSLQSLHRDLRDGLPAYLARLQIDASDGRRVTEAIAAYVQRAAAPWRDRAHDAVASWERDLGVLAELLDRIDWVPINRLAERAGLPAGYPDTIKAQLGAVRQQLVAVGASLPGDDLGAATGDGTSPVPAAEGLLRSLLVGGGAAALSRILLGINPVGMTVVAAGGLVASQFYDRNARRAEFLRRCELHGREFIRRAIEDAERNARAHLEASAGRLQQVVQEEFDALGSLLAAAGDPAASLDPARNDREALETLHRRLLEAVRT